MASESVCPECGVGVGDFHAQGCEFEVCPFCGRAMESCGCMGRIVQLRARERTPWAGETPGVAECRAFGWFKKGGAACGPDEPGAEPDVERLYAEAVWDGVNRRWVKNNGADGDRERSKANVT